MEHELPLEGEVELRLAREMMMRSGRAAVYALAAYALLRVQSVYNGPFFLVSATIFGLAMARKSLVLIQVLLGILFTVAILSDWLASFPAKMAIAL